MGNGDSKQERELDNGLPDNQPKKEFQIVDAVQQCLSELPIKGSMSDDEKAIEDLITTHEKIRYKASQDILLKNTESPGVYIIKKGTVEILTEQRELRISTFSQGNFFGEVSTLYNVPCTARVGALTDCELVLLKKEAIRNHTKGYVTMEMMDWFVRRRYLPTAANFNRTRMLRRLCLKIFNNLPVFSKWSDTALKNLILSLGADLLVMYPDMSTIMDEGDPAVFMYIVIRGRVRVKRGDTFIADFNTEREPVAFNEEGLRFGIDSCFRLQAKTPCQVIPVRLTEIRLAVAKKLLMKKKSVIPPCSLYSYSWCMFEANHMLMRGREATETRQKGVNPWQQRHKLWTLREDFVKTDLYKEHAAELQIEVLAKELKKSDVFELCSLAILYDLVLESKVMQYKRRSKIIFPADSGSDVVVVVLSGHVKIKPKTEKTYTLQPASEGESFFDPLAMEEDYAVTASTDCIIIEIPRDKAADITGGEE